MATSRLRTVRLELVPATAAIVAAELSGRMDLSREIGADVPISWPPEYFDGSSAKALLAMLEADPESLGWGTWYVVRHDMLRFPIVIGVCGYKGPPDDDGTVEIGCSILIDHRRRGYATEATAALIGRAWAFPEVQRVVADVLPSLIPAVGTLEKLGFCPISADPERGTSRYQLQRR
jgi:ribosomal-protein-alanine N-acetyltransferase